MLTNWSNIHKNLNLDSWLYKTKLKKKTSFHILRWSGFLMIPLKTLYDENINRQTLTEQKNQYESIVPPPSRGVGIKRVF